MRTLSRFLPYFLFVFNIVRAQALTEDAWQALLKNDYAQAEKGFRSSLALRPNDIKAHSGLFLLYGLKMQDSLAVEELKASTDHNPEAAPYIYACLGRVQQYMEKGTCNQSIKEILTKASENGDSTGLLSAVAREAMASLLREEGHIKASDSIFASIGGIRDFCLIGPFENISSSGYSKRYPPEKESKKGAIYEGKSGQPAAWFRLKEIRPDGWIDFQRYFASDDAVFYAQSFVYLKEPKKLDLRIGTSGSFKAFLNDVEILASEEESNNDLDTYVTSVQFNKGWNRLLFKLGYSEISRCNFFARITDKNGRPIPDLRFSAENKDYTPIAEKGEIIQCFAESYFKSRIAKDKANVENYIYLADCYLRNDKANLAELLLKEALKYAPGSTLIRDLLEEAYIRGKKQDEALSLQEEAYQRDKESPLAAIQKYYRFIDTKQYDKAELLLKEIEQLLPESTDYYQALMNYYSVRKLTDRLSEASLKAKNKFPLYWDFAYNEAQLAFTKTKNYDDAIRIIKEFSNKRLTTEALSALAQSYLNSSKIKEWEDCMLRVIALDGASTGFYQSLAENFKSLQDYDKAQKYIEKALDLCPSSSSYWGTLADIHRIKNENSEAIQAYRNALVYDPTNFEAREKLRGLSGMRPIFDNFDSTRVDSLIKFAPGHIEYPDDNAIVLTHNLNRVVYEKGTSENTEEYLIKLFDQDAIDNLKEFRISYVPRSQELSVEKALTIKKDGTSVQADISESEVVFKSLQENDCIYLKYRLRNNYIGILSKHIWDEFDFSNPYPVKSASYSIIAPEDYAYSFKSNMDGLKPIRKKTRDGILSEWKIKDLPATKYEYGMPPMSDVGKTLYISSIPDWGEILRWYQDLSESKTRPSFEVKAQVENIISDLKEKTDMEKAKAIYQFITDNISYSSLPFRQSAMIPQKARDVLVTKIGDCKDMACLAVSMLREAGIKAYFVLVRTKDEGLNAGGLPSVSAFNHAIAAFEASGKIYFMDLTAQGYPFLSVPQGDLGAFCLLIKDGNKNPENLAKTGLISTTVKRQCSIRLNENDSAEISRIGRLSGIAAGDFRNFFRFRGSKDQKKVLMEEISQEFPNFRFQSFRFSDLMNLNAPVNFEYNFTALNYANDLRGFKLIKFPWVDALSLGKACSYEKREQPYIFDSSVDSTEESIEVSLPRGMTALNLPGNTELKNDIIDYRLEISLSDNTLKGKRTMVLKKDRLQPEDYVKFKEFYNRLLKADELQILFKKD